MEIPGVNNSGWGRVMLMPCWSGYRELAYVNEPFNDPDSISKWRQLGYTQTRFTGDMYDMKNQEPAWMERLKRHFPWKHFSWSIYRMGPGCVLPQHRDTYAKFRQIYQIQDPKVIYRAIIFLEHWQSGHYFEIQNMPIVGWGAGDCIIWQYDVPHTAANVGLEDRYTLQITGVPEGPKFVRFIDTDSTTTGFGVVR